MARIFDFVDEGLGHSSYVIDLGDGTAVVIDPPRFPTATWSSLIGKDFALPGPLTPIPMLTT